jgi:integrase
MGHPLPTTLRTLTRDEIQRLLAAAQHHESETWLLMALVTGLRRGELLALRWVDVDCQQGTLMVRSTVDGTGGVVEPKTGPRKLVLPALLIPTLQQHRQRQDERKQGQGAVWREDDLVFPDPCGGLLTGAALRRSLDAIAARAEVAPVRFHALRRTTMSLMLEAGISPAMVQAMLGIRQVALPLAHLSPLSLAMQREAMVKLDASLHHLLP